MMNKVGKEKILGLDEMPLVAPLKEKSEGECGFRKKVMNSLYTILRERTV